MSEQKAKGNENSSGKTSGQNSSAVALPTPVPTQGWQGEMTREQALAVAWTGLRVLALNHQLVIFNDLAGKVAYLGIANAKVIRSADGKTVKLLDLELPTPVPTQAANAPESVGAPLAEGGNDG